MKKLVQYQGKSISYTLRGKGQPVMLLHGFGETAAVWNSIADTLETSCELLIPDLPGSAESDMIGDMRMEGMAHALKSLTGELGWETFTIIGHSMGGYIALAFAELYPNDLRGLGLFHSTAYADSEEKTATRRKGIAFIREHGAKEFLKNTSPNLFAPDTRKERPELIDQLIADTDNFSADTLVSYYESMIQRPDRSALLSSVSYPVLIVMGKYDQAVPMEDTLKLCKLPKKAYIHTLSQSGHMGMLEQPRESINLLREYLADL